MDKNRRLIQAIHSNLVIMKSVVKIQTSSSFVLEIIPDIKD